jgi:hypothetical protein
MAAIGACGDDCTECPRALALRSGRRTELEKVKELWVRIGLRDSSFPAEQLGCSGCTPQNACAYSEVRDCAFGKGLENCGLCPSYPCDAVTAVFQKTENLRRGLNRKCSPQESGLLEKAFCRKKQNLDKIRRRDRG